MWKDNLHSEIFLQHFIQLTCTVSVWGIIYPSLSVVHKYRDVSSVSHRAEVCGSVLAVEWLGMTLCCFTSWLTAMLANYRQRDPTVMMAGVTDMSSLRCMVCSSLTESKHRVREQNGSVYLKSRDLDLKRQESYQCQQL